MPGDATIEVAIRAARRAASVIIDAARDLQRLPVHVKAHDLATISKGEAEDAIVATLRTAFPSHAILGEESGQIAGAREGAGYKWMVHGIDGAANFAHRYPHYAIAIALAHGSRLTHALIFDPIHDELFIAIEGQGAELNGTAIHVSACALLHNALVGTTVPAQGSALLPAYLAAGSVLTERCAGVRSAGSSALDLAYVAAGRLDGFWTSGVHGWDLAAGALIVKEAGGRIGDFTGNPDFLRSTEVIAATPGLFNTLREALVANPPAVG